MTLTRKCITAVLLVLIMMPALYSIYFQANQQFIRLEMWSSIGEADNVICIHESTFKWVVKDREIVVNGFMFDVKSIEKIGDSLRITGEYDYEETDLNSQMKSVEESREEDGQGSDSIHVLVQVMDDSVCNLFAGFFDSDVIGTKTCTQPFTLSAIYAGTISPPPKA